MAEKTAPTGIDDNQLAALVAGGWFDNVGSVSPCWERSVPVVDGDDIRQRLCTSPASPHWGANSGMEWMSDDNFGAVLGWCDDRALDSKVEMTERTATKQEDRFAEMLDWGEAADI